MKITRVSEIYACCLTKAKIRIRVSKSFSLLSQKLRGQQRSSILQQDAITILNSCFSNIRGLVDIPDFNGQAGARHNQIHCRCCNSAWENI